MGARSIKTHTFRGLRYRVSLDDTVRGYAEAPGPRKPREIYIDTRLPPTEHLEVAIHEAMHAEDPDVPERVIDRRARSLARWLWRIGYRRHSTEDTE